MRIALVLKGAWFALFFLSLLGSVTIADDGVTAMQEVRNTISSQIDAFRQNDIKKAYTFAAPNIQAQFPSPEVFGLMVRNGYPVIWRPKSFKFTKFKDLGNSCIQRVLFQSFDGSLESYDYILEKSDGNWRIAGVLTIKSADET
tara:strand:+ start:770 stop:1201 length:432 start_codon:yes stop_codon:yes gene_type:complete